MLDRLDAARRELADLRDLAIGRLRVAAFARADAALVPQAIAAFQQRHPAVSVSLREGFTSELLEMLGSGDADAAVVSYPDTQHLDGFELRSGTTSCTSRSLMTIGSLVRGRCGWPIFATKSGSPEAGSPRTR